MLPQARKIPQRKRRKKCNEIEAPYVLRAPLKRPPGSRPHALTRREPGSLRAYMARSPYRRYPFLRRPRRTPHSPSDTPLLLGPLGDPPSTWMRILARQPKVEQASCAAPRGQGGHLPSSRQGFFSLTPASWQSRTKMSGRFTSGELGCQTPLNQKSGNEDTKNGKRDVFK